MTVLQCVAVCCNGLQCVSACLSFRVCLHVSACVYVCVCVCVCLRESLFLSVCLCLCLCLCVCLWCVCVSLRVLTIGFHVGIAADEHSGQHRKKQSRAHSCHYCTSVGVSRNTKENEAQNKGTRKGNVWSALEDAVATTFGKWQVGPAKTKTSQTRAYTHCTNTQTHSKLQTPPLTVQVSAEQRCRDGADSAKK